MTSPGRIARLDRALGLCVALSVAACHPRDPDAPPDAAVPAEDLAAFGSPADLATLPDALPVERVDCGPGAPRPDAMFGCATSCRAICPAVSFDLHCDLTGVWAASRDEVWFIDRRNLILHYDGVAWRPLASPAPYLTAIWGSGPSDIWAVGARGAIIHYDGRQWSAALSPTTEDLLDIRGAAADEVWAMAESALLRFDGKAWSVVALPDGTKFSVVPARSARLAVIAANDVWALHADQRRNALHWDGATWRDVPISTGAGLEHVFASGPRDVWALGVEYVGPELIQHWYAYHFDGGAWTESRVPGAYYTALFGTGPSDAWIFGPTGSLHFDGQAWAPACGAFASGVAATARDDLWGVEQQSAAHFDGAGWRSCWLCR